MFTVVLYSLKIKRLVLSWERPQCPSGNKTHYQCNLLSPFPSAAGCCLSFTGCFRVPSEHQCFLAIDCYTHDCWPRWLCSAASTSLGNRTRGECCGASKHLGGQQAVGLGGPLDCSKKGSCNLDSLATPLWLLIGHTPIMWQSHQLHQAPLLLSQPPCVIGQAVRWRLASVLCGCVEFEPGLLAPSPTLKSYTASGLQKRTGSRLAVAVHEEWVRELDEWWAERKIQATSHS